MALKAKFRSQEMERTTEPFHRYGNDKNDDEYDGVIGGNVCNNDNEYEDNDDSFHRNDDNDALNGVNVCFDD